MSEPKSSKADGPVLIELTDEAGQIPGPDTAPPVPAEDGAEIAGRAMHQAAALAARPGSRLGRWFWGIAVALVGFFASLAAWDYVTALLASRPVLGYVATGLLSAFIVVLLIVALREAAAFFRLGRLDTLRRGAESALASADLDAGRASLDRLQALYRGRAELRIGQAEVDRRRAEVFEVADLFALAEANLIAPLDRAAEAEIAAAARQVATVTALVPIALADVITALAANLRMIRRIAEIYGGRAGTLGAWRLTRAVLTHLVATGAVAVGDDLISSFAGGSVVSKVSRRFGEGVVNGALTARVGVAAMDVCRPLPFGPDRRPAVSGLVRKALVGLFGRDPG